MSTRNLQKLGNKLTIPIEPDEGGYVGRECPNPDCLEYFKVTGGTGLPDAEDCVCPYCGTKESSDHFWTQDQIRYAESVAERELLSAFHKDLKSMEFSVKPPRGGFGIGISLKVQPPQLPRVRRYQEKALETEVVCARCTLRYAIYGVFAYCPDCGVHNSLGILEANLVLVEKMLRLAEEQQDPSLRSKLIADAAENCVSTFDGWGRGTTEAFCAKSTDPAARVSFQNLSKAQQKVTRLFRHDLASPVTASEFNALNTLFQKRHLVAHRMGVVDLEYIASTGDASTPEGRKVSFDAKEVLVTLGLLRTVSKAFFAHLEGLP